MRGRRGEREEGEWGGEGGEGDVINSLSLITFCHVYIA